MRAKRSGSPFATTHPRRACRFLKPLDAGAGLLELTAEEVEERARKVRAAMGP